MARKQEDIKLIINNNISPTHHGKRKEYGERYKLQRIHCYRNTVKEDEENYYINFNTGLGEAIYPKSDWTLEKAPYDQEHVFDESK